MYLDSTAQLVIASLALTLSQSLSPPLTQFVFHLAGTYYCMSMTLISVSMFLCLFSINFHYRGDNRKPVPAWLIKIMSSRLARYGGFDLQVKTNASCSGEFDKIPSQETPHTDKSKISQLMNNYAHYAESLSSSSSSLLPPGRDTCASYYKVRTRNLCRHFAVIEKSIKLLRALEEQEDNTNRINEEWRTVGIFLDRIFFATYIVLTSCFLAFFLPRADSLDIDQSGAASSSNSTAKAFL
ncbi:hypothetical protein Ciccas_007642 [Cichlidogyrus casuarinus]|uniref:Neurotransmitter-gated ion-channel transmembrane domain-containing protein n=1 Tax=Cichlidogyrus casuarinus TaxID=1844966 RepID=A0ABD2Q2C9_9PLAT